LATGPPGIPVQKLENSPRPVPKFPKIPVPKNTPKQATIELSEASIPLVLQVFRGLHSAGLQRAIN